MLAKSIFKGMLACKKANTAVVKTGSPVFHPETLTIMFETPIKWYFTPIPVGITKELRDKLSFHQNVARVNY